MNEDERNKSRGELEQALTIGTIVDATPEQLQRWLVSLCTGHIPNQMVHPREIVRGITINHIQMARTIIHLEETIKRLDADNRRTQRLVIILAYVAIVVGVIQAVASVIALFR